jgi:hypothetical protein
VIRKTHTLSQLIICAEQKLLDAGFALRELEIGLVESIWR